MTTPSPSPSRQSVRATIAFRAALALVLGAAVVELVAFFFAFETWQAIGRLERDEIQMLRLWSPVAALYRAGGRYAALAPYALLALAANVAMIAGALRMVKLRSHVSRDAMRRAALIEQRGVAPFHRSVDATGAVPRRTLVMAAVLLLLIAGTAWYVITGRAAAPRREGVSTEPR